MDKHLDVKEIGFPYEKKIEKAITKRWDLKSCFYKSPSFTEIIWKNVLACFTNTYPDNSCLTKK